MDDPGSSTDPTLRTERFDHADFSVELRLPASSEALIDASEFNRDERLPYWAELWPSARALARLLLERGDLPPRALELGAGLALPCMALAHRGVAALATDYYQDALRFADGNAARNRLLLQTRHFDWRDAPEALGSFPLVVAADVLYEARNAANLAALVPAVVAPGGELVLADPGRLHLGGFLERMEACGWSVTRLPVRIESSPAGEGLQVHVQLFRLNRTSERHRPTPKL
ncbi:MAG: methyltransferase domain-containing protein [Gemmatimonadota bacterium]